MKAICAICWDCTSVYFNLQWLSWTSMNICQSVSFSNLTTVGEPNSLKCIWNKTCIYFPSNTSGCKTRTIPRLWTSIHTFVIMIHNSLFANIDLFSNLINGGITSPACNLYSKLLAVRKIKYVKNYFFNPKSDCLFALSLRFSKYIVVMLIKSTNYIYSYESFFCTFKHKHKTDLQAVKQKFFLDCTMLTSKMTWFIRSSRIALMTFFLLSGK